MIQVDAFFVLLLVFIIVCWSCYRRKLSKAAYGIAGLDLFLRIVAFLSTIKGIPGLTTFLAKWPNDLLSVADKYTDGLVYLLIGWAFIILMIYFLFLTLSTFFKK